MFQFQSSSGRSIAVLAVDLVVDGTVVISVTVVVIFVVFVLFAVVTVFVVAVEETVVFAEDEGLLLCVVETAVSLSVVVVTTVAAVVDVVFVGAGCGSSPQPVTNRPIPHKTAINSIVGFIIRSVLSTLLPRRRSRSWL